MLTDSNDLLIVLIGLLVLLLIVVLIAASKSKSNKISGGGPSTGTLSGGGTGEITGGGKGSGSTGGGGIYIDSSLREGDGVRTADSRIVDRTIPDDADSGHDIVRIYVDKHRAGLIVCPNCDAENIRGASRCIACGYIL